jgi:hypothetical protein
VLTFPAGQIEPDPQVYPGALKSLRTWTDSAGAFVRLAPETAVLPVLVRGVVWKKAAHHPLLAIKKTRNEKETMAAALQLLAHVMWNIKPVTVRVQVGRPVRAAELGTTDPAAIHTAVIAEMARLINHPPLGEGEGLLS